MSTNGEEQQPLGYKERTKRIVQRASVRLNETEDQFLQQSEPLKKHKHPKILVRVTALLIVFSLLCFLIWIATTPYQYPWFIHPIYVSVLISGIIFIVYSPRYGDKIFAIHTLIFSSTAVMLIFMNEHLGAYPWSIYPVCALSFLYGVHFFYAQLNMKTINMWVYYVHALLFTAVMIMLFVTYFYTVHHFPWIVIVLLGWGAILLAHYILYRVIEMRIDRHGPKSDESDEQIPKEPDTASADHNSNFHAREYQPPQESLAAPPPPDQHPHPQPQYSNQFSGEVEDLDEFYRHEQDEVNNDQYDQRQSDHDYSE